VRDGGRYKARKYVAGLRGLRRAIAVPAAGVCVRAARQREGLIETE
jgi:hypothetical protein